MLDGLSKNIAQNVKKGTLDLVTGNFKMLSLDITSLFPTIPLDETIGYATEIF